MYVWNSQLKVTFELLRDINVLKFAYQFMFRKANLCMKYSALTPGAAVKFIGDSVL